MTFKPMLAGKAGDLSSVQFPVMVSAKLDGVRALVIDGAVMSRSLKPIPNAWVQKQFSDLPNGTDGELIYGDPTHPDAYRNTVSAVMSEDGEPTQVQFYAFDNFTAKGGFQERFRKVQDLASDLLFPNVQVVPHSLVDKSEDLAAIEAIAVEAGYEGVMLRSTNGPYKQGRSTTNEGYLLKVKRFEDSEAIIESVYEWETNNNVAKTNALGRTERSSHKNGKVGANVLGGLNVRGLEGTYKGVEFSIGTGFSGADDPDGERGKLWKRRAALVGKIVKFKYFKTGGLDRPRFPVFLGWRDARDMS